MVISKEEGSTVCSFGLTKQFQKKSLGQLDQLGSSWGWGGECIRKAHLLIATFRKQLLEEFDHMRLLRVLIGKAALAFGHCAAEACKDAC